MLVNVKNENYGYTVATHDDWVVVGNPSSFRLPNASVGSFPWYQTLTEWDEDVSLWGSISGSATGSIDIFRYNTLTDQHDLIATIYQPVGAADEVLLAEDPTAEYIHTDIFKSAWIPVISFGGHHHWYYWVREDLPIRIDATEYANKIEDDYGHSIDVYNDVLAVGCRWYNQTINVSGKQFFVTGSSVDIYNLTALKNAAFYDGYIATGSNFLATVIPPSVGEPMSGSFGFSVSLNNEWLAVGSPLWNSTFGGVHMYRKQLPVDPNNFTWNFFTTLTGSATIIGDHFGYAIDINKETGSYSGSIVVGCGNKITGGNKVYYFEFNGIDWQEKYTFSPDRAVYKLPFYDVNPIIRCEDYAIDGFGNAVALYKDDICIGAPTDRWIYEYSGSRAYKQGAAYLYNRCSNRDNGWRLVKKFYGNEDTLKNNKMGFSVDLWDDKCIISNPKSNLETMSSCYIEGSISQQNYCYVNLENYINGQWVLLQKNTSSADIDWDVLNVYQRKKRFLSPYRSFGYDVAIANKSIAIGAPMLISGSNRDINITNTGSIQSKTIIELEDLTGKSYIYNLKNFRDNFHVGNVFYHNGKVVLNTSGSVFEGLWFNPVNEYNYEYEINFDNKQTLYEKQIVCTVEPGEFNVSTNPTAITREKAIFDLNANGWFDWQDMDIILRYMQMLNTKYSATAMTMDWSSSLLTTDDEVSFYNFNSTNNCYYNTNSDFISQSFFSILNNISTNTFDFNQDSKIDTNDLNIFWKYCSKRLTQENYQTYITPNSKRKLFSDITDYLDNSTKRTTSPTIRPEFLTYVDQSANDKTGSYLAPYITTIGLYSNGGVLVATAKLGQPIKNNGNFPLNIVVKMDF